MTNEAALAAEAMVIRGGSQRDPSFLLGRLTKLMEKGKRPAASVFAMNQQKGSNRDALLKQLCEASDLPHPKVQVAVLSALTTKGFTLELDTSDGQAECHYNVYFDEPVTEARVIDFIQCFAESEANPTGGR